jgi:hypothetical protein
VTPPTAWAPALRQQVAHLGIVFLGLAERQQGVEGRQHVARQRRDAVDGARRVPGQQAVRAQAVQHRFQAFRDQVGEFRVDVGAREGRTGGVGGQFAQHQQAHQDAVLAAVEQRRERGQHRLRALEVEDLLDFVRRDAVLEMRGERIQLVGRHAMGFRGEGRACLYVDHVGYQFASAKGTAAAQQSQRGSPAVSRGRQV